MVQEPLPNQGGTGAVCVGGFMAKYERCHEDHFQKDAGCARIYEGRYRLSPHGDI